jgi:hypothetical protein
MPLLDLQRLEQLQQLIQQTWSESLVVVLKNILTSQCLKGKMD